MRSIAKWSFYVAIAVTIALVIAAVIVARNLAAAPPPPTALPLLNFVLDMFKAILAGFVVGMLGILIPAVASETRQRFEQRKESRKAYSEAKTSVDYLKLRLASANLTEATIILKDAHLKKHMAELFDDFPVWLKRRFGRTMTAKQWDNQMYDRLSGARQVLEKNAGSWDALGAADRIALLKDVLPMN